MTRAGLYCRISRDPDDLQEGVDRQREDGEPSPPSASARIVDTSLLPIPNTSCEEEQGN
jgi:hypothetical protein